ncbi:hypothetical protein BpHYR1_041108 [Brachionus plicatilis]|uniref:Uncharacterized protein n=1 Tax=Brachionus plicatilis TaxID=10195 RepID=A0A3M7S406_BRAPC|nr:hypothetical protein BpHYR1_041108 [Brachionus plicatilis]
MSSPFESVAPKILSGINPLSKPLGCTSFSISMLDIFFFLGTTSCSSFRLGLLASRSLASKSSINSGQSRFSTGSQVLSALKRKF